MTPYETWKRNKWRPDLRKCTREFEKNFKIKTKCQFEPGKVYAITYTTDSNFPTDKWHVTPVILSLGNFRDDDGHVNVRGVNLFYLTTRQSIDILDDSYPYVTKKAGARVLPIVKVHDKYLQVFPWAYKNFIDLRIRTSIEIDPEEWGMIPLLHKYLIGNFNPVGLNDDFQLEIKKKPRRFFNQEKKKTEEVDEEEKLEIYEDLNSSEFDDLDIIDDI